MSVRAVGRVAEQNASWSKKELDLLSQAIKDNIETVKQAKKEGKSYFQFIYNENNPEILVLRPVKTVSEQKDCTYGRAEEIIREQIKLFSEKGGTKKDIDLHEMQLTEALNMKLQTSEEHKQKASTLSRVLGAAGLRRLTTGSSTTAAAPSVGRASLSSQTFESPETAANGTASPAAPPLPARRSVAPPSDTSEALVLSEDATELACLQADYYVGAVKKNDPIRVDPLDRSHRLLSPKEKKGQVIPYERGAVSVLNFFYSIPMNEDTPENLVEQISNATMNVASVAMEYVFQKKIGEFFNSFLTKEAALHGSSFNEAEETQTQLLQLFSDLSKFAFALHPSDKTSLVNLDNFEEAILLLIRKLSYVKEGLGIYHKLSSETALEYNKLYSCFYGNADISDQIEDIKSLIRQGFQKIENQDQSLTVGILSLGFSKTDYGKKLWSTKEIASLLSALTPKIDQLTLHINLNREHDQLTNIGAKHCHRRVHLLREEVVVRIKELCDKDENPYWEKLDAKDRQILGEMEKTARDGLGVAELRLRSATMLPEGEEEEKKAAV